MRNKPPSISSFEKLQIAVDNMLDHSWYNPATESWETPPNFVQVVANARKSDPSLLVTSDQYLDMSFCMALKDGGVHHQGVFSCLDSLDDADILSTFRATADHRGDKITNMRIVIGLDNYDIMREHNKNK